MTEPLYRIGEAARLLELETYVLRFWETEFAQLEPLRTPKGQRLYTATHLDLLRRVKMLLYEDGLTIDGARKVLARERGQAEPVIPNAPPVPATELASTEPGTLKLLHPAKPAKLAQGPVLPRVTAIKDNASLRLLRELRVELSSLQAFVREPRASSSHPVPSSDTSEEPSA